LARLFAITNQKGGVGKTTTSINLAASLAATKKRVLLVDMDPQGNATMGVGVDKYDLFLSVLDVLVGECEAKEAIQRDGSKQFDVLPANADLTAAEVELLDVDHKETRLADALSAIQADYDFIIIDCPPSLNMLTVNALSAAHSVLVPMQCEYYALEGLSSLVDTINKIQRVINPSLHLEGILRTMYDPRNSLTNEVSQQLKDYFGDRLYRTVIPRNIRLAEAPSYGLPVLNYDRQSKGAIAYLALAGEVIRRAEHIAMSA
jgi:chromosome partitioning protein